MDTVEQDVILARTKERAGRLADRLEEMVKELREGKAFVIQEFVQADPTTPHVQHVSTEFFRDNSSTVVLRESTRYLREIPW